MALEKSDIIAACKKIEPNPEHGPGQYEVVIDMLIEEYPGFMNRTKSDAVKTVMDWMNMGED